MSPALRALSWGVSIRPELVRRLIEPQSRLEEDV
jgi:hypothetical protein